MYLNASYPSAFVNAQCLSFTSGLVSTSVIISFVGQHFKHISWFSSFSQMKWCCISICLVPEWCVGFFASAMHPWLSHMMDVGPSCTYPTIVKSYLSQTHFLYAMASGHVLRLYRKQIMVGCFLHFHKMTPMPIKNTCPVVDHQSFASPIQSALQNPHKAISLSMRHNLKFKMPFKYLMMRFTDIQCSRPAFSMNWFTILTANTSSALVSTIAYMKYPTVALYGTPCISLCTFPTCSLENFNNFKFALNRIPTGLHSSRLNTLGLPWCTFFYLWWWYGLPYSTQIPLLKINATLWDCLSQIPSWVFIWATST